MIGSRRKYLESLSIDINEIVNKFYKPNTTFIANLINENIYSYDLNNGTLSFSFDTRGQLLEIKANNYLKKKRF